MTNILKLDISYLDLPEYGPRRGFNSFELSPAILTNEKLIVSGQNNGEYSRVITNLI